MMSNADHRAIRGSAVQHVCCDARLHHASSAGVGRTQRHIVCSGERSVVRREDDLAKAVRREVGRPQASAQSSSAPRSPVVRPDRDPAPIRAPGENRNGDVEPSRAPFVQHGCGNPGPAGLAGCRTETSEIQVPDAGLRTPVDGADPAQYRCCVVHRGRDAAGGVQRSVASLLVGQRATKREAPGRDPCDDDLDDARLEVDRSEDDGRVGPRTVTIRFADAHAGGVPDDHRCVDGLGHRQSISRSGRARGTQLVAHAAGSLGRPAELQK